MTDLKFAIRLWLNRPGSFLAGVAALTLGIGLVTFSLCAINCVFFGRLPVPEADRIVYATVPEWAFHEFQEHQTTFEELSAFATASVNFKAADASMRRRVCYIGANFLDLVRVKPTLGRGFFPHEEGPGAEGVALIGYDLWQREFRGDPAAVGSVLRLDGQPRSIVGILPQGFKFPIDDDLWLPADPPTLRARGWGFGFGRLKPSVTIGEARTELNHLAARIAAASLAPEMKPAPILVGPFTRFLSGIKGAHGPGPSLFAMLFLTLLVLAVACANVAGLTFANAIKRGTELAVRGALGASRARLILQMLMENLILAVSGAGGGLLIVAALDKWFEGILARDAEFAQVPFWMHIQIDGQLLLALVGLTFLANLLAGLWPALQATKRDVNELLKAQTGGTSGLRVGKFQRLLVMAQVAFSVVILTQTFVLLSYSQRLKQVTLPFNPAAILTARVDVPPSVEPHLFIDQLERNLKQLPGVQSVALSSSDPVSGYRQRPVAVEGTDYPRPEDRPYAGFATVSAGFFETLSVPVLQGRNFTADDVTGSTPVAIVNAAFANRFLPSGNPLGRRFREGTNAWVTVVGCVSVVDCEPWDGYQPPVYFIPLSQQPARSMVISLRGNGRAMDWAKTLRTEVTRLQPDLAIYHVATAQALLERDTMGYHVASVLLGICGGGALLLSTLGILGLITLSVNQRTREIGIRLALGSGRGRLVRALLKQVIRQIAAGLTAGTLLAYALTQLLTSNIPKFPVVDQPAAVYLASVVFLGTISLMAVLIPAARAAKVDPMVALRYE